MTDTLSTGTYYVDAPCPRCGAIEAILVQISSVLTTPETEGGTLRVKIKGKPREHDCQQGRITVDAMLEADQSK